MSVRWGFIGTGGIARKVGAALGAAEGGARYAVASRDAERAARFAAENGFERSHGSVEALLADDVDVVYVATPHPQHLVAAREALQAGKPVLVEKPMTATLAGSRELVQLARDTGTFCMEAVWTRFLPGTEALLDVVRRGEIGEVRSLHADLGAPAPVDAARFWDPALGGGALLDVGPYPVRLAHLLLGPPTSVQAVGCLSPGGVDVQAGLLLGHAGGALSALSVSISSHSAQRAWVEGTEGWVEVGAPIYAAPSLVLHRPGREPEAVEFAESRGHAHMLEHVHECLAAGRVESPLLPLSGTLEVMAVLDTALDALGAVRTVEA
ncbi:putative dehydrogenase [Kineococcus xinjiangensis]|uniref:Putative dehydrogenase n=1 Tax=Kineococcus xinjiangensis TaxID=512762 RepID=A0A2S6IC39_9ACTN|nr:Gfo/Idh/MocA family oxidoreductase [Kineococcus xinjiangensis]PPK90798.1 putative dehydrogenase [Kineococcus xinjiangensis]